MPRLSNTALSIVLILFVSSVSLALIAAAWLMATHILNGPVRSPLPKWLFIGLLMMSLNQAKAQTPTTNTYVVTEVYTKHPTDQPTVLHAADTALNTLPQPVQTKDSRRKRRISPTPAWPSDNVPTAASPNEPDVSSVFYIMAVAPNPSAHKTGYWFRSRP